MAMEFPALDGTIVTVKADPKEARQCYVQSLKVDPYSLKTRREQATQTEEFQTPVDECNQVEQAAADPTTDKEDVDLDPRAEYEGERPTLDEPMSTVQLGPSPYQNTRVVLNTPGSVRESIKQVLTANSDLFAWSPADMPGIDPNFMCHKLALLPHLKPVSQRKRKLGEERRVAVEMEVA